MRFLGWVLLYVALLPGILVAGQAFGVGGALLVIAAPHLLRRSSARSV